MPAGPLSTDLYELTMAAVYFASGKTSISSFELFVRTLPGTRGYLIAAGLEQVISYLEKWRFTAAEIMYLRSIPELGAADPKFFEDFLPNLRFTGDVWAVAEGTPIFAGEPIVRVTAPLPEAQLVETALLTTTLFQTAIASKAARVSEAAGGRPVIEFGGRRAHGTDAAMYAARASYLAGCQATSNLEAGYRFGLPVSGTMSHSWVMSHSDELEAFSRHMEVYGEQSVLLIDTYDPIGAANLIVRAGLQPAAVRLDSGNLARLSLAVRKILDGGGLGETKIFVSGDLDEYKVEALVSSDVPVDGFGVGTALSTSSDAPSLNGVYKLVEIDRGGTMMPLMKLSPEKVTYPGAKQVWRVRDSSGPVHDVLGLRTEANPVGGEPLLSCVVKGGVRQQPMRAIEEVQRYCRSALGSFPKEVRYCRNAAVYPVVISTTLDGLTATLSSKLSERSDTVDWNSRLL